MKRLMLFACAAAAAWVLGGDTIRVAPASETPLAQLCGDGSRFAQRDRLRFFLGAAEAYAQTLPGDLNAPPPLMMGLGDAHLAITTSQPQAQAFFDQGLRLSYAFNHYEAIRAFRHAQRLDPDCAMCFWGEALALGPNINAPMPAEDYAAAYAAARAAREKSASATPVEQALIEALQFRYTAVAPVTRTGLDGAFAEAMAAVADRFPDNDVVQNVAAEAAMDTQPWDYWEADGVTPKGRAGAAVRRIETVLDRSPRDAGAIHLYIHLVEASKDPWRAEDGAQRLDRATPQAGHLVHMPAHIYYGVGRFRDSIRANIAAAAADEAYIAAANPSPIYRYGYYPHNVHFVLTSAAMAGDARTTLQYADKLDEAVPMEMAAAVVLAQAVKAAPWFAKAQFADPASVLAAERPPEGVTYVEGAWRYARGVAQARAGNGDGARVEAAAITQLIETGDFKAMNEANIPAQTILDIYRRIVEARALMAESKFADAIPVLREAVAMQTQVPYTEPPYLYYPLRRTLAGAYLMNGQPAVAEMEFLLTLTESPNDAYAYWGLAEARRQRGDRRGAAAARTLFQQAYLGRGSLNAGAL
jgi:tetratricopeptide (TPR) repeat protein